MKELEPSRLVPLAPKTNVFTNSPGQHEQVVNLQ